MPPNPTDITDTKWIWYLMPFFRLSNEWMNEPSPTICFQKGCHKEHWNKVLTSGLWIIWKPTLVFNHLSHQGVSSSISCNYNIFKLFALDWPSGEGQKSASCCLRSWCQAAPLLIPGFLDGNSQPNLMLPTKPPSPARCLLPPGLHLGRVNGLSSHQRLLSTAAASSPSLNQSPSTFHLKNMKKHLSLDITCFIVFVVYALAIFSLYNCRRALGVKDNKHLLFVFLFSPTLLLNKICFQALGGHDKVKSYHESTESLGMHCRLDLLHQWAGQSVSFQRSPASPCLGADLALPADLERTEGVWLRNLENRENRGGFTS